MVMIIMHNKYDDFFLHLITLVYIVIVICLYKDSNLVFSLYLIELLITKTDLISMSTEI